MEGTPAGGAARFSCPPDFAVIPPAPEPPGFSLETLTGPDTELWLIQAPADFAPDCLNGRLVPLSGSQIVKGKSAGQRHRYQVLSSSAQAGGATLLAPSVQAGGGLLCAPAPQGSLRILEGPQESLSRTPLQPIPASAPPQIPPGLKPRFCAFGGSPPVTGPGSALALKPPASGKRKKKRQMPEASATQEAVNGHGVLEVDTALGCPEMDTGKKKKKKKHLEEPEVMEPVAEMSEHLEVPFQTSSKKRKKSKRTETVHPETGMPEPEEKAEELELMVKPESPKEMVLSPTKKRKRRKEVEGIGPIEETVSESQPQEEAIPLPPMKKKKKKKEKKKGRDVVEPQMSALEPHTEMMEPELPDELGLQAEVTLVPPKKKKKKEKQQSVMPEPLGTSEVVESSLQEDCAPQVAPASTKKERGHRATKPGAELTEPPAGTVGPEDGAAPRPAKKRKKQVQEIGVPGMMPQEEMPEVLPNPESGEVAPTEGREKKRKRKAQQDLM